MKELLEPVLKQLPDFIPSLGKLVTRPKTSIQRWIEEEQGALAKPLIFVAVSVGIGFLLQLPRVGKDQSLTTIVSAMAGFKIVALIVFAAVIHGLFRALRGQARFRQTFAAYLYAVSPLYMALVLLDLATHGTLRGYGSEFAAAVSADPYLSADPKRWREFEAAEPGLSLAYNLLNVAKLVLMLAWGVACWGAFRQLHGVTRLRSAFAGFAAVGSLYLFQFASQAILRGMFDTAVPSLQ